MPNSLEVFHHRKLVFSSTGSWLHPLFELERVIETSAMNPAELEVHDKIVGAASAFLIVSLGIRTLHAGILSRQGETVLKRFAVSFTSDTLVDRIGCATESILDPAMEVADAVAILRQRASAKKKDSD
jgi:hypothetical protein